MRRREFVAGLAGAAALLSGARAQQSDKIPAVGFLGATKSSAQSQWNAAFLERLRELGWIEGRTVAIHVRSAEGHFDRSAEIIAEFLRLKVDVIVTHGTPNIVAAKQATSAIPIVFATAGDPVGSGLVASLAQPGHNLTGLSLQSAELAGKRLALLSDVIPGIRRLAFLVNATNPNSALEIAEVQAAARTLGLEVVIAEVRRAEDIGPAVEALKGRSEALYAQADPLLLSNAVWINNLALLVGLPAIYAQRDYIEAGGLMSYGASFPDLFRRAAGYVDKILRGARPANLPVEEATKFELILNLKAAKLLGVTIPPSLLARADEVIE